MRHKYKSKVENEVGGRWWRKGAQGGSLGLVSLDLTGRPTRLRVGLFRGRRESKQGRVPEETAAARHLQQGRLQTRRHVEGVRWHGFTPVLLLLIT